RDEYLHELLRRDGCMNHEAEDHTCRVCGLTSDTFVRCISCFGSEMMCGGCCVARHAANPFHKTWNGRYFEKTTLKQLGLRVQLGHPLGQPCLTPRRLYNGFVVLHTNGIHEVDVYLCDCEHADRAGAAEIQMLRAGWFPATDDVPRTCATFECLDLFTTATLQAKTTAYDFYWMLEKMTDSTGGKLPDRYAPLLRMIREYSHLMMLKRGGIGHKPRGVASTAPGALAVHCPNSP
ncbi:hypothetical protein FB45DRAFT_686383, partial [Roridomyces roridus]